MNKIFNTLNIEKQVPELTNLGYKNLIVSGCSFTHNSSNEYCVSWPYYLRDMAGFKTVLDTSMPGAGNYHIANSLQWAIENDMPDPKESLVIVMWSGNDRDDFIIPRLGFTNGPHKFHYSTKSGTAITGGAAGISNLWPELAEKMKRFTELKTKESRAIENYLIINATKHYLENKGFSYYFLDYIDREVPNRTLDFSIEPYLPKPLANSLNDSKLKVENLYVYSLKHEFLSDDDFHPVSEGHYQWVKNCLLPAIIKNKY